MISAMETVLRFNACIGARDLDRLTSLMTDDHAFIDTAGHRVDGKPACVEAWRSFFATFPDYHNVFDRILERGDEVVIAGASHCSDPALAGPALWSAKIRDDRIREWRVFNNTTANRKQLGLD